MSKEKIKEIEAKANQIKIDIIEMIGRSGSGHPGGSLSISDIVAVLYFEKMRYRSDDPQWEDRDRLVLSKGHAAPAVYSALSLAGFFSRDYLKTLRQIGTSLQGHPDRTSLPGIDMSTGSLGQGLSVAVGMALAAKMDKKEHRIYCIIGDGESQEGQIWEAAMSAGHRKTDNLTVILDHNKLQIDGRVEDIKGLSPVADKWRAFRWNAIDKVDGHDVRALLKAFDEAEKTKGRPTIIIADTVKGKGVSFMEHNVDFHGKAPNKEETEKALSELRCRQ
ncbi:MAG: transketolase [Candidatus Saganbacteria bacterium]|nr:transketolase [Candidatus Saganbacteria bacterium]